MSHSLWYKTALSRRFVSWQDISLALHAQILLYIFQKQVDHSEDTIHKLPRGLNTELESN